MNAGRATVFLAGMILLVACQEKKAGPAGATSAAATGVATLKPPATPIKAGQSFVIGWTGPNGANDYVDLVAGGHLQVGDEMGYAKTSAGNPTKLTAPTAPGTYEVRYIQDTGSRAVIAHIPVTVVP